MNSTVNLQSSLIEICTLGVGGRQMYCIYMMVKTLTLNDYVSILHQSGNTYDFCPGGPSSNADKNTGYPEVLCAFPHYHHNGIMLPCR
jgi:hypothetical protein